MYLKRSLIKQQAKQLIRENIFKLFVISLIVSLCVSLISGISSAVSAYNTYSQGYEFFKEFSESGDFEEYFDKYFDEYFGEYFDENYNGSDDSDYFDGFGDEGRDFHNFSGELKLIPAKSEAVSGAYYDFSFGLLGSPYLPFIITALLAPLAVTLAGLYVSFIRGKKFEFEDGIKTVFTDAFKVNYLKKVGVYALRTVITSLLSMLFLIPGIIFAYSSYFAFQIMCDYPELSAWEAIKLSKKIIKGNRFELFLMNLSFLPWGLLCIFVFPMIYVLPYFETTNALYYENFRLRAIQQGRVTQDDFLSNAQRCAKYGAMGNNQYYSPNTAQQGVYYYTPQPPQQPQYGAPNYYVPYQQFNQAANPQYQPYGSNINQPYGVPVNPPYGAPVNQPFGAPVNQPYGFAPNTPHEQQTPPVNPQEQTYPAESQESTPYAEAQEQTPPVEAQQQTANECETPAEPQEAPQEEPNYEATNPAEPEESSGEE